MIQERFGTDFFNNEKKNTVKIKADLKFHHILITCQHCGKTVEEGAVIKSDNLSRLVIDGVLDYHCENCNCNFFKGTLTQEIKVSV